MTQRLIGIDVNGWHDWAARDDLPAEAESRTEAPLKMIDGGIESAAVKLVGADRWAGGPQAALAPHGRGRGWGDIGAPERRVGLTELWSEMLTDRFSDNAAAYRAAVDGLAHDAEDVTLAVPDRREFDEVVQGDLLRLFQGQRRRHRLLWRPVALFLDALETGEIRRNEVDHDFRLLLHGTDGIEVQRLRLKKDPEHSEHMAPERQGHGHLRLQGYGLCRLRVRVQRAVAEATDAGGFRDLGLSRLPMQLLAGTAGPGDFDIMRHDNGSWWQAVAPEISPDETLGSVLSLPDGDDEAEVATFLATPLGGAFAEALVTRLRALWPNLRELPFEGVGRGCLHAGRLIERGLPHYFDRLEPIGLAILRDRQPVFAELIDDSATVPANREYKSLPFKNLTWRQGQTNMEFYIRKGKAEMRHWLVRRETPPPRDVKVELRIRQRPGQSWARLFVTSHEWDALGQAPIYLDWEECQRIGLSPEEVLEKLTVPSPTVPNRIVEQADMVFWQGGGFIKTGLLDVLDDVLDGVRKQDDRSLNNKLDDRSWKNLADCVAKPYLHPTTSKPIHPISTDGEFPAGLSETAIQDFTFLLEAIAKRLLSECRHGRLQNNHATRCLTWCFTRCPAPVQELVVEAHEALAEKRNHPLRTPRGADRAIEQGVGRVVHEPALLRRVFQSLKTRPYDRNDAISALAMITSRRAEAPRALTPELVEHFFKAMAEALWSTLLQDNLKTKFKNTLLAIAGLFRWRNVEPNALLAKDDPMAKEVRVMLVLAQDHIQANAATVPQAELKMQLIGKIIEYLDGKGDPDILFQIVGLDD